MNVDILFSIVGQKPPRLPLREERQTDGVEIVYNAKGTGHSAVCKEQQRREALLLEKLNRLEKKLERKPSYKRTKKRERALLMVKELKYQMENSVCGISYDQYLDELRKMKKEIKREKRSLEIQLNPRNDDIAATGHNGSISRDDSSFVSEASTVHIESKVMKALQTLFDDPELDDITDDEQLLDDNTADETTTTNDVNTTSESLPSVDMLTSVVKNNNTQDAKDDGPLSNNGNDTLLREDSERDDLEEDHKWWEEREKSLPETIGISLSGTTSRSAKTTHTSKTHKASNFDTTTDVDKKTEKTLDTIEGSRSSSRSRGVRFKDVKPTLDDHLARARAILNNAKDLQKSFSLESTGSADKDPSEEGAKEVVSEPITTTQKISPLPQRYSLKVPIVSEKERYHIFLSHACPYSHRVLIIHALKRLQKVVSFSYIHCKWDPIPLWDDDANLDVNNERSFWSISKDDSSDDDDDDISKSFKMHLLNQEVSGRIRLPVLWDKKENRIVCNKCIQVMKILNFEFNNFSKRSKLNLFPAGFKRENEDINKWINNDLFIPLYKCGLATSQSQYDDAIEEVTNGLDKADQIVKKRGFLAGEKLTESDIRLFVILLRFDEVYRVLFKANTRMVAKMPGLMDYMKDIYDVKGIAETCDMEKIKREFYGFYGARGTPYVVPRGRFIELLANSSSI